MIACQFSDQTANPADVIEQLLIDASCGAVVRLAQGLIGASCITAPEPGYGELAQQWRFRSSPGGLFEVLRRLAVTVPFEGNRPEGGEGVVSQFAGGDLQSFPSEITGGSEVFAELGFHERQLVRREPARQLIAFFFLIDAPRKSPSRFQSARVAQ